MLTVAATLGGFATTGSAATFSLAQWASRYLTYIGASATGPSDPRLTFLEKWATLEGTFYLGNEFNPLNTELDAPDAGLWNSAGVRTYPTLLEGYQATLATMEQGFDSPILTALRNRSSTVSSLTTALARSNWTGGGQSSSDEIGYANGVGKGPVGPDGPVGPTTATTMVNVKGGAAALKVPVGAGSKRSDNDWGSTPVATIRGTILNPLGQPLGGVCVATEAREGWPVSTATSSSGAFRLGPFPQDNVRLEITDCHGSAGGAAPMFYDERVPDRHTTSVARAATTIELGCSSGTCASKNVRLHPPVVYGVVSPRVAWAVPAAITYGTALSASELDAASPVPGTFTYSPTFGAVPVAGTTKLTVTFTPIDTTDYRSAHGTVSLEVDKATPTVSWPTPQSITYGTALSTTQLDATSDVHGAFSYRSSAGTILGAGTRTLSATFTPSDSNDFESVPASTTLTVGQAIPTLTSTPVTNAVPGSKLTAAELGVKTAVSGSMSYAPPIGSVVTSGSMPVIVTLTPSDAVDYLSATETVTLDASQSSPALTWATPSAIAAGSALSSIQLDARASQPGTFTYSPLAGTVLAPGTHPLAVTFTPTNSAAFLGSSTTVLLVVEPLVNPTLSWPTPTPIASGTALSSVQLDAHTSIAGSYAYTPASGSVLSAGGHTLSVTFTPTNPAADNSATVTVNLVVNPPISPTITWPTPTPVASGTALSSVQLDAHASVPGTFVYLPAAGTVLGSGSQVLSETFTPMNSVAYASVTTTVLLVVNPPISPTITWPTPSPVATGSALSSVQLDAHASVPGAFEYSVPLGAPVAKGPNVISVTFFPTDTVTYADVTASVTVTGT